MDGTAHDKTVDAVGEGNMKENDLAAIESLRRACQQVLEGARQEPTYQPWLDQLTRFLADVRSAEEAERASPEFQKRLWDDSPVAAIGMGTVKVDEALADAEFRQWIARESVRSVPPEEEASQIRTLYRGLVERFEQLGQRVPRLKIFRVLAALFPAHMTTVAARGMLRDLHVAMGLPPTKDALDRQFQVMSKVNEAMGPCDGSLQAVARRMTVPWLLYKSLVADPKGPAPGGPRDEKLIPRPAIRRRRGMTGLSGYLTNAIGVLDFAEEGVTREQLIDFVRTQNPSLKDNSIGVQINVLISELGVLEHKDNLYRPTERGERLLESSDPDELQDWLLTRILGIDHLLIFLAEDGPQTLGELFPRLQSVNPGWTTNFGPGVLLSWLRALKLVTRDDNGRWNLTERGHEWRGRVTWTPEVLEKESGEIGEPPTDTERGDGADSVQLPSLAAIVEIVAKAGNFKRSVISELHSALWHSPRRHFAILTGLSGSGKTLLARAYAQGLAGSDGDATPQLCTVPVQPGWYEPSSLLGYVNPLSNESYVRTAFLEFLLRAASDPLHPYTVVLDEMNLSHPEQYLAPILSAMETGASVALHREADVLDGVPASVAYPSNLAIIGTVNMDETTHGLSDKVLDRAHTIEFWDVSVDEYPKWGETGLSAEQEASIKEILVDLMTALAPVRLHFGWRIIDDVTGYLRHRCAEDPGEFVAAASEAIYAKVLPKLRGEDSVRLVQAFEETRTALRRHRLGRCAAKVDELLDDLRAQGTARFWR